MGRKHLDLMELRIFEAIMSERNVSRAADRLGLTQSVVSKGLGHLRVMFKDPLFIRSSSGMRPTHKAIEISRGISHSVSILENLLSDNRAFDPLSAHLNYTIGVSDYASYVLLPELVKAILCIAPHVTLQTREISDNTAEELLLSGQVDLCLASDASFTYPIHYTELFRDQYVCVARAGHPIEAAPLTVDEFIDHQHLVMPRQSGGTMGVVEQALSAMNLTRRVAISVSSLLSVPEILEKTNMLMTTTSKIAAKLQRHAGLTIHEHPLQLGPLRFTQLWHERNDRSLSHKWLRQQIVNCATDLRP
jgi:DNA-binding transcriptional LysR family regulator